jgi:ATP-dependent Clp protease ATP-binding subunit ClpC
MIREGGGTGLRVLKDLGCDVSALRHTIEQGLIPSTSKLSTGELNLRTGSRGVISEASVLANELNAKVMASEHILLAIMSDNHLAVSRLMQKEYSVTFEKVKNHLTKNSRRMSNSK